MLTSKSRPTCRFLNSLFGGPPLNEYFEVCTEKATSKTTDDLKNYEESARKQKKHKHSRDHVPVMLCPKNLNEVVNKLLTGTDSEEKSLDVLLTTLPEMTEDGVPTKGVKNLYIKGRVYYGKPNREPDTPVTETRQAVRLKGTDVFLEHRTPDVEEVPWEAVERVYDHESGANAFGPGELFDVGTLASHANPSLAVNMMTQASFDHLGREFTEDAETQTALEEQTQAAGSQYSDSEECDLLTTITITRSRTHFIKYSDGIEVTEKIGRENFVYGKPLMKRGSPASSLVEIYRPGQDVKGVSGHKVVKDEYGYLPPHPERRYVDKRPSIECENSGCDSEEGIRERGTEFENTAGIVADSSFGEILPNGYNPLTWLYKSYSKTKAFIKEFSVST